MMHPRLWIVIHAPPRASDDAMWCDVCDEWKRRTYRVPPRLNSHGLTDTPSFRICHPCLVSDWDGNGAEFLRQTAEWKAMEEAYLSLITDGDVETKIRSMVRDVRQRFEVPGFRKGHAPLELIRQKFRDKLVGEAMEELLIERMRTGSLASRIPARERGPDPPEDDAHSPAGTRPTAGESDPPTTTVPRGSPAP